MSSRLPCCALLVASALVAPAFAQTPPSASAAATGAAPANVTPALPASAAAEAEVVELTPFTVQAGEDNGYQATNTTSGSRLQTKLKDTPASISPFTPEFLADIGATSLQDMMAFATNAEVETEDATNGFNNPEGRFATTTDSRFRMRGMASGASRDYVDSAIPVDLYNVERAELASGPNSILFGLGSAGGNIALTTKRADLNRSRTVVTNVIGSWEYERLTLDHNIPLVKKKAAFRLLGLYQNAHGWRYWDFNDQKRLGGALALRPFKHTAIHLQGEAGKGDGSTSVGWNAADQITAWLRAGRPQGDGAAITGTTRNSTNQRYTFVENDNAMYNYRQELVSTRAYSSETLLPPSLSAYAFNPVGPGGQRHQRFRSHSMLVEQKAGTVAFELGYFRNRNDVVANSNDGQPVLFADPNITIPLPSLATTLPNPRAGQLYLEQPWTRDTVTLTNEVIRLTTAWEKDLGKWFGRHRLAGLLENARSYRLRYLKNEILADQNNAAITNAANPEGAQNTIYRRNYVTEGDFRTYYPGNGQIPLPALAFNGNTYHPQYVSRTKANAHAKKDIDAFMLAAQSYWWGGRVVTTLGYRRDAIVFRNENEARIASPTDPRVVNKSRVLNEWDFTGTYRKNEYQPNTFTAGGVFHATNRVSVFFNSATNKGTPQFDRTVLPNGDVPPPTGGRSQDYGVMLDLFGDDRYFLRATRFDTRQIGDAPIIPNGLAVETSDVLGGTNLTTIYDALLSAGRITQAQHDDQLVSYSGGMVDVYTKGYEIEFVANPTKSLTLRFGYSHSERNRVNVFKEIFDYYAAKTPEWLKLAQGNAALTDTINTQLAAIYDKLDDQLDVQSGPLGSRPDKFNATARYQLRQGRFKGLAFGGSVRYQGANVMSYNRTTNVTTRGNETCFGDAFTTYKRKAPWGRGTLTLQLNVRNLTNSYLVGIGRRNADASYIRRVYLNEPRSYRFTTTLEF